jgi:HK97 gp10 family phage protein
MTTYIEGMNELEKSIRKLGNMKQSDVTMPAKKGANVALKDAKSNAPQKTGQLKKGIVLQGEKSRNKGKKVYQVTFDSSMNSVFQKTSKNKKGSAYYPASQEYGFILRDGQKKQGLNFMKRSLEDNSSEIQKVIITEMSKKIDKALR